MKWKAIGGKQIGVTIAVVAGASIAVALICFGAVLAYMMQENNTGSGEVAE